MDADESLFDGNDLEAALTSHDSLFDDQHGARIRRYGSNNTSQLAIVGSNLCPIESLDYELVENDFLKKQDWRSLEPIHIVQYIFLKWTLCFLIGALSGALGFFNNLAVENIAGVKFVVTFNMMLADRYWTAFAVFAVSNLVLLMFAVIITTFISPAAAGSGIPEVKAYLNGVDAPNIFSLKTLVVKMQVSQKKNLSLLGPRLPGSAQRGWALTQAQATRKELGQHSMLIEIWESCADVGAARRLHARAKEAGGCWLGDQTRGDGVYNDRARGGYKAPHNRRMRKEKSRLQQRAADAASPRGTGKGSVASDDSDARKEKRGGRLERETRASAR